MGARASGSPLMLQKSVMHQGKSEETEEGTKSVETNTEQRGAVQRRVPSGTTEKKDELMESADAAQQVAQQLP